MNATTLRPLRDLRMTDADQVGGKAASLGELLAEDVRVPDGVVLTAGRRDAIRRRAPGAARRWRRGRWATARSRSAPAASARTASIVRLPACTNRRWTSLSTGLAEAADRTPGQRWWQPTSPATPRVGNGADAGVAVIVQRMVHAAAAGVALTADPITGDRRLPSLPPSEAPATDWSQARPWATSGSSASGAATARRRTESAIDAGRPWRSPPRRVASPTRRNTPQDVEWAIDDDGTLWIVQARPMTALPPQVSWDPGAPGASRDSSDWRVDR